MQRIAMPLPHRLESRDLRLVVALAAARTTAAAAERLHLTQPAVSRALLGCEERLGVRLFERTPRGLEPTAAGQAVLDAAPAVLDAIAALETRLRQPAVAPTRLRLVCECYTAYHWMPSALQGLRAALPGIDLQIVIDATRDPVGALEQGEIDVALVSEARMPRSRRLAHKPLFADEIVFLLAASHPLAARPSLTRADLAGQALYASRAPTGEMTWFTRPLAARGAPTLEFHALPLTEAVVDFARAGLGIGVLSEWVAEPHLRRGDVVARRLATGALRRPWQLVWRREVEEAALELWQVLQKASPRVMAMPVERGRKQA